MKNISKKFEKFLTKKNLLIGGIGAASVASLFYIWKKYHSRRKIFKNLQKQIPLTKQKAELRSSAIQDPCSYDVTLRLEDGDYFEGLVRVDFAVSNNIENAVFLEFSGTQIYEIKLNGKSIEPNWDGSYIVLPKDSLNLGKNVVEISFQSKFVNDAQGLHKFIDTDNKQYIYSNLEPYYLGRIFPCFDQPDIKGNYEVQLITLNNYVGIGNEICTCKCPFDVSQTWIYEHNLNPTQFLKGLNSEKHILYKFKKTVPISSYLFCMISGEFEEVKVENTYNNIPQSLYCRKSLLHALERDKAIIVETSNKSLEFYSKFFKYQYPFSKNDFIFCPEYNVGAMENIGAVTYNDKYLFKDEVTLEFISRRSATIAHELAHMWFGNLVTMKWWSDLWLNESFADFVALYCLRQTQNDYTSMKLSDYGVMAHFRKAWGYAEDQLITTHPIACNVNDTEEADDIFDGITYSKGQSVIRQLLNLLGHDSFSNAMGVYFEKYQYSNTTLDQFINTLDSEFQKQAGAEISLSDWKQQWLLSAGTNVLIPEWDNTSKILKIHQKCALPQFPTLRYHQMKVGYFDEKCKVIKVENILVKNQELTEVKMNVTGNIAAILLNYEDECFMKIYFDEKSSIFFKNNLDKISTNLSKALIWRTFYDMVRDAIMTSTAYFELIKQYLEKETDSSILNLFMDFGSAAYSQYTPEKQKKIISSDMFTILNNILLNCSDKQKVIQLRNRLVFYTKNQSQLTALLDLVKQGEAAPANYKFTMNEKTSLMRKLFNNKEIDRETKKQNLEFYLSLDNSEQAKNLEKEFEVMMPAEDIKIAKSKYWQEFLYTKSNYSSETYESMMSGFYYIADETLNECLEKEQIDNYFAALKYIFANKSLPYQKTFYFFLFPNSEPLIYYILEKINSLHNEIQNDQKYSVLAKNLLMSKDSLQKKKRAYDLFE